MQHVNTLKMRGTPIDLIHSYFLADSPTDANAAFKTSLLENIYEKLDNEFKCDVTFCTSTLPHIKNIDGATNYSIAFQWNTKITDDSKASVVALIEKLTNDTIEYVRNKITPNVIKICIISDLCDTKLQFLHTSFDGEIHFNVRFETL
jgi:hypothetical protein